MFKKCLKSVKVQNGQHPRPAVHEGDLEEEEVVEEVEEFEEGRRERASKEQSRSGANGSSVHGGAEPKAAGAAAARLRHRRQHRHRPLRLQRQERRRSQLPEGRATHCHQEAQSRLVAGAEDRHRREGIHSRQLRRLRRLGG